MIDSGGEASLLKSGLLSQMEWRSQYKDQHRRALTATKVRRVQAGCILVLIALYLVQTATPLRLHPDTVIMFSIAETAEQGGGYLFHGKHTVFPPGYPTLLAFLIRLHMAHVWVIVALNVLFLVIGLLAAYSIFRSEQFSQAFALGVCILSLLSFVFIKYSAIPLTDTMFFGVSLWSVALIKKAAAEFNWRTLAAGVVLLIASVCTRRIGVALIPALLCALSLQFSVRRYLAQISHRKKATMALAAACAGGVMVWIVAATSTLLDFSAALAGHTVIESARGILTFRLNELGEIGVNLPASALPAMIQSVLPVIGLFVCLLAAAGVSGRKTIGVVEAYFLSYAAIILVWPFYDPRFWLPVIPLLIAYSALALKRLVRWKSAGHVVAGYATMFVLAGLVSMVFNTSLSFSGPKFADLYTGGYYHSTYCAVWHCRELGSERVDPDALHLLRTYK
uniref:Glycosyltransferase RgtA/B/C/D-like domain-containing protein n=1 Tax=Solibacter usitatus (strain Ellin6076) TaxID=234267 RepID=Q02CJ5_SOLUE